ncbi:MAG: SPFH domain-containing protein [candidate division SR1 bacterium]|nr:SPFH domain-containing protein [candidate division SR1 bacterium]
MNSVFLIGGVVLVIAIVVIGLISFIARNYIKVPPNKVAIFYGRKSKKADGSETGFKVVTGGAKFKIPILESITWLDLNVYSINLDVQGAPNKDGVPVNLQGVANVKIMSDEASLMAAAERFLGMDQRAIQDVAYKNLEGHLRAIAGTMTVEDLVGDRSKLNQSILSEAAADLKKMGFGIDLLTITKVSDDKGYIEQLGKKRTAEVVRDAEIGKATADKESKIQTTTAQQEAAVKANENSVITFQSDKDRDVQKANFRAEVSKQEAAADQAGPLATATARQGVVVAEQEVLKVEADKAAEVAESIALRTEKELISSKIKPAEAQKKASIINAEGIQQSAIIDAEGKQKAATMIAEGEKQKVTKEGEGAAAANKAKLLAEAEGNKAKGLAEAAVMEAKLLAEANGKKAILLAEAEGLLKKAEAYKQLDDAGKLLQILDVVERVLPSAIEKFAGVMEAAAKPFESIDKISIVDFGGGGANGGTALTKFGQTAPQMVMQFFTAMQASGLDVNGLFNKLGIDTKKIMTSDSDTEKK